MRKFAAQDDEELMEVIGNVHLNPHFLKLAKELDVEEAKSPEDIFKSGQCRGLGARRGRGGGWGASAFVRRVACWCVVASAKPERPRWCGLRSGASRGPSAVDSARQNLAATFVNAFVNCGFGSDKLVTPEGSDWVPSPQFHGSFAPRSTIHALSVVLTSHMPLFRRPTAPV